MIVVSGTPGTGKTLLAKILAKKFKLKYIDVNKIIKKNKLYESYDKSRKTYVVDIKKLIQFLIKLIKENNKIIIDSHLAHNIPSKYVDYCFITTCDIKVLKKRLQLRKYNKLKIKENLEVETFDSCLTEAQELKHNIKVINTTNFKKKDMEKYVLKNYHKI